MKKYTLVLAVVLSIISAQAFAVGTTGCGLGSMIFTKNTFVSQTFAATTNSVGLSYSLTTQTSNCKLDGFVMNEKEKVYFVEANFRHLEGEMARGSGENLSALASLYGCGPEMVPAFARMTKAEYSSIVSSEKTSANEALQALERKFQESPLLPVLCNNTI